MIYQLAHTLQNYWPFLNVVHYTSFRINIALLTVLFLFICFGDIFITIFEKIFKSKPREYLPETHQVKRGLPTMGGLFIIGSVVISTFLWSNLSHSEVWIFLVCLIGFGCIGFVDDWYKLTGKKGISEKSKFKAQFVMALGVVTLWLYCLPVSTKLCFPLFKNIQPDLGFFFIPWAMFIIIGTSNAVNLTDGLDGLAISSLIVNFSTFAIIAYLAGHSAFAHYLNIPFAGTAEMSIIAVILAGASIGFLWFNAHPAQIIMGDVGSLSLGASLGLLALMTKQELLLPISGGLFVIETVSVILQVISYKIFSKRLFKMAPLHHHFELLGWPEGKIAIRFSILSGIFCLCALMLIKVR